MLGYRWFLWMWPSEFFSITRDGQKKWQVGTWPRFLQPQRVERDKKVAKKECIKLAKVRRRGYVKMGEVKISTHYFLVSKGKEIRIMYNGKPSGLI